MARRKMSAKQRRFFGGGARRSVRAAGRSVKRFSRRAGRSTLGGLVPTSMQDSLVNFGAGASMPYVSGLVAPLTDGLLAPLGSYKDEARTALIGCALSYVGSGVIKQAGKAYFDFAVTSAGVQMGAGLVNGTGLGNTAGGNYL